MIQFIIFGLLLIISIYILFTYETIYYNKTFSILQIINFTYETIYYKKTLIPYINKCLLR